MNYKLIAYSICETGKREKQEDCLYPAITLDGAPMDGPLFILCDGMGGHMAGEVASQTVCDAMSSYILSHQPFTEAVFSASLDAAYDALDLRDSGSDGLRTMGTTLTLAYFYEDGCWVAHIGDSRVYQIRPSQKQILFVTQDHSLVNDLVKVGEMTPEEARTAPEKNVLTRAMQPHQDVRSKATCRLLEDIQEGDYFFLCSDGMLEQMDEDQLLEIVSSPCADTEKVALLRRAAQDSKDNHSAHLIRVEAVLK